MTEIWKAIPGYEGAYEVSDLGRVRSLDRTVVVVRKDGSRRIRPYPGTTRAQTPDDDGYLKLTLYVDGCGRTFAVHQLVALVFVGACPAGEQVRHKDGRKQNNVATNLHYGTPKQNTHDAIAHGTFPHSERHRKARLTRYDVYAIRAARGRVRQVDLAKQYGIPQPNISAIQLRKHWRHV